MLEFSSDKLTWSGIGGDQSYGVWTIFDHAKVYTIPCKCSATGSLSLLDSDKLTTLTLGQQIDERLCSLFITYGMDKWYIESTEKSCTNDEDHIGRKKRVKNASYYFKEFLSASAILPFSILIAWERTVTSILLSCASHLQGYIPFKWSNYLAYQKRRKSLQNIMK